jgi:hypothetical protein
MARLTDILKLPATLRQELPGPIRDELDDWEVDPANLRREIADLLAHYKRERNLSRSDLNKAKKILTDKKLFNRVTGR